MSAGWRDVMALLRGKVPGAYPQERAMLWAVVIVGLTAIALITYLSVRDLIAGWPL